MSKYNPKNWVPGDFVRCNADVPGQYFKGREYQITGIDLRPDFMIVKTIDSDGNKNGWGIHYFSYIEPDIGFLEVQVYIQSRMTYNRFIN